LVQLHSQVLWWSEPLSYKQFKPEFVCVGTLTGPPALYTFAHN